jgi:hypothetical protein
MSRKGERITMGRKQNTEYKDIIHESFKPAYLFSKVLGVMPLSYKRKRTSNFKKAYTRGACVTEFVWSWKSAIYSGLWIALHITLKYWIFHTRPHHPPPAVKPSSDRGYLSSGNFSERNTSHYPPLFPTGREMWIGSMNDILDFACTILALVIGILGTRKVPEIFRQLQHLDEDADEDGYLLLGKQLFLKFPLNL